MSSQDKQGEQNAGLHSKGTGYSILILISSLMPLEGHFTLTGKQKEDSSTIKVDTPQNHTPNGSQTPGQAVEESSLVHNANLLGHLIAKPASETEQQTGVRKEAAYSAKAKSDS